MHNFKLLVFLFSTIFILTSFQSVYAHGLGTVESDIQFFNDSYFKVKVQTTPDVLTGNESEIGFKITTINHDQNSIVSDIEYFVNISDPKTGESLLSFNAYSPDELFYAKIIPTSKISISGDKTDNEFWIGSLDNPLLIEAPLFIHGGLVQVDVDILSINSESIPRPPSFETLLTIGEYIPFEITADVKYDLMFATYFDKIDEFHYDQKNKKLIADMPFNWDINFIKKIPYVHAEYYIPKSMDVFNNHEIKMTVNKIPILGTIDRSGDDEIVVHFLIPTKKLLKLHDEIPSDTHDKIIFGLQSGKIRDIQKNDASLELGDKIIILSTQEDWKFHLALTPVGKINPQNEILINLEFHDPITNIIIPQITYDLDIFLNGKQIESLHNLETISGKDYVPVIFDKTGTVLLQISNVNNFDTSGEFSFQVIEPKTEIVSDKIIKIALNSSITGCELNKSCYSPYDQRISSGEIILWKNIDSTAHTVTSGSPDEGKSNYFDSGIIGPQNNFSHQFNDSGSFSYFCELHPWMIGLVSVNNSQVPPWIKNNAGWWADGTIDDNSFITGLKYLIDNNILFTSSQSNSFDSVENKIPSWIKTNAGWWADGTLSDNDFLVCVEWLVSNEIINIE
jgi:plastocyanin